MDVAIFVCERKKITKKNRYRDEGESENCEKMRENGANALETVRMNFLGVFLCVNSMCSCSWRKYLLLKKKKTQISKDARRGIGRGKKTNIREEMRNREKKRSIKERNGNGK